MEKTNGIAQEIHNERWQLHSPMKAWIVLAIFAGVSPAALVTLVQMPLGRQTESATYVDSCGHVPPRWKYPHHPGCANTNCHALHRAYNECGGRAW